MAASCALQNIIIPDIVLYSNSVLEICIVDSRSEACQNLFGNA